MVEALGPLVLQPKLAEVSLPALSPSNRAVTLLPGILEQNSQVQYAFGT